MLCIQYTNRFRLFPSHRSALIRLFSPVPSGFRSSMAVFTYRYQRAPRCGPEHLPEEYRCRFSFCCDRDGCRKRMTPPSARFLGRKVYLGAVVILISAMRQGPMPRRARELSTLLGVDRATIARWQASGATTFRRRLSGKSKAVKRA